MHNIWHDTFVIKHSGEKVEFSPLGREGGYNDAYGFAILFSDGTSYRYHNVYAGGDQLPRELPEEFIPRVLAQHAGNRTQREVARDIPLAHLNDPFLRKAFYGEVAEFVTYGHFGLSQYGDTSETTLLQGWEVDAKFAAHWRNPLAFHNINAPRGSFEVEPPMSLVSYKEDANARWDRRQVAKRLTRRTVLEWEVSVNELLQKLEILLPVIWKHDLREALPYGIPNTYGVDYFFEDRFNSIHNSADKHHYTLRVVETAATCIVALSQMELGFRQRKQFVRMMKEAVQSRNHRIQAVAMDALWELNEENDHETLKRALRMLELDGYEWRLMALRHLARLWHRRVHHEELPLMEAVLAAMEDPHPDVRNAAANIALANPKDFEEQIDATADFAHAYGVETSAYNLFFYKIDPAVKRWETALYEAFRDAVVKAKRQSRRRAR